MTEEHKTDGFEVAVILSEVTQDGPLRLQHFTYDIEMYSTPKSTVTMTDPTRTEKDDNDD